MTTPQTLSDRMLESLAKGSPELALSQATAAVKADLASGVGLLVMGRALGQLGQNAVAVRALEMAADRARAQSLPLAIAATVWLRELGEETSARLDRLSQLYARGSKALRSDKAAPPKLPSAKASTEPDPAPLTGDALLRNADPVLEYARAALDAVGDEELQDLPPQPLFSSLSQPALRRMLELFGVAVLPSGSAVVEQGSVGDQAFIVARGECEVERRIPPSDGGEGERVVLARLGTGALFGEMALLARAPRAASVIAARPTQVL